MVKVCLVCVCGGQREYKVSYGKARPKVQLFMFLYA